MSEWLKRWDNYAKECYSAIRKGKTSVRKPCWLENHNSKMLHIVICVTFLKWRNYKSGAQNRGCQGSTTGVGGVSVVRGAVGMTPAVMETSVAWPRTVSASWYNVPQFTWWYHWGNWLRGMWESPCYFAQLHVTLSWRQHKKFNPSWSLTDYHK